MEHLPHGSTIVLADGLPRETRREIGRLTRTIPQRSMPRTASQDIPPGYTVITSVLIDDTRCQLEATEGPVPRANEHAVRLGCGTRHAIVVKRATDGCWRFAYDGESAC
ncbi:MAG: hypothetical protein JOZ54_13895 [Acidobacteria bacterium]|nr:hypothetical protein [Acidobacteriota bacterium]